MVDCPNCNKFYNDDFDFCPYCGTKKPAPKICPKCEISTYESYMFCPKCGTELISKIEFNSEINYIINLIYNEDFDNAISKCTQLNIVKDYDGPTIHSLLKEIDDSKKRGKKRKKEEKTKAEFEKIVEDTDLDTTSKSELITKINNNEIITENTLKVEISREKRKSELRKMVNDAELDHYSKNKFINKINYNHITDKFVLSNEISKSEKEMKKSKLIKIVKNADLTTSSKSELIKKINKNFIIYESTLEEEINQKEKRQKRLLEDPSVRQCPICKKPVSKFLDECPNCGYYF